MSSKLTNSKNKAGQYVPELTGNNYLVWSQAMRAYLRYQGTWGVLARKRCPVPADTSKLTNSEINDMEEWDEKDDKALGAISLRLKPSMHQHIKGTTLDTWNALKSVYGTPGISVQFSDFMEAIHFQIAEGQNPLNSISSMQSLFERLVKNGLELGDKIKATLILAALPPPWGEWISMIIIQKAGETMTGTGSNKVT